MEKILTAFWLYKIMKNETGLGPLCIVPYATRFCKLLRSPGIDSLEYSIHGVGNLQSFAMAVELVHRRTHSFTTEINFTANLLLFSIIFGSAGHRTWKNWATADNKHPTPDTQQPGTNNNHRQGHPTTETQQPGTNNNPRQRHPTIYSQHSTNWHPTNQWWANTLT